MADRVRRPINTRPRAMISAAVSTIVAAVAVLSIALAPAASAGGYIVSDAYFCSQGQISIKPPRTWTTNARPEAVFWSPVLHRWQNNAWVPIAHWQPAVATVNNQGYAVVGWTDTAAYYGVRSRSFTIGQAGYYAVANYLVWADGSTEFTWATPPDSRGYCTFTTRTVEPGRDLVEAPAEQDAGPVDFVERILRPVRAIVALYVDATVAQAPGPPDGQAPRSPAA